MESEVIFSKMGRFQPFAIDLVIDAIDFTGNGLARQDGKIYSIPGTIPGEKIRAQIFGGERDRFQGDLLEILQRSPKRLNSKCPHFGICGGCQYQHLPYENQLELKREQIKTLIINELELEFPINNTLPSPRQYGYRTKITPHYARIRQGDEPIGFQKIGRHSIEDIENCPIASRGINEALPKLRAKIRSKLTKRGGTALLRQGKDTISDDFNGLLNESIGDLNFQFYAGDFFQNNAAILPDFVNYVVGKAFTQTVDYLVDSYCGVGVFAIAAADKFREVQGIEINREAIQLAKLNAELNGKKNVTFLTGSAECIFQTVKFPAEKTTILLDPPRKGSDFSFLNQLLRFAPQRIVYVSCGPENQMRDLKILLSEYQLEDIQPVDLFPQTKHIENIVTLRRKNTMICHRSFA